MKVTIFSHESDLDGIFSAAIGLIRYPQARVVFLNYGKDSFMKLKAFTEINADSNEEGLVIVADLGLNPDPVLINICKDTFSTIRKSNSRVLWIDHHPWSEETIREIKPYAELILESAGSKCAADLMYEKFLLGHPVAKTLASLAHAMDYFTFDQFLTPTSELIRYYHTFSDRYTRLTNLARKSSLGILWDVQMQIEYAEFVLLRDEAKEQAFSTLQIRTTGTIKTALIRTSPYIQNSLFSDEVFKRTGADLVIFYGGDGRVSIRRNNNEIPCNEIANRLADGGGHPFAAGGMLRSDPNDLDAVISELESAVLTSLHNVKAEN